jgi:IstB-like ATP binding protein
VYLAPKVLIIDEMGYLPLDEMGSTIFFQLVSARYERGSIILTSNKSYGDTAMNNRILEHCGCTTAARSSILGHRISGSAIRNGLHTSEPVMLSSPDNSGISATRRRNYCGKPLF